MDKMIQIIVIEQSVEKIHNRCIFTACNFPGLVSIIKRHCSKKTGDLSLHKPAYTVATRINTIFPKHNFELVRSLYQKPRNFRTV